MLDTLLYLLGRAFIGLVQLPPLGLIARLGRLGGTIAWILDRRHRRIAIDNLTAAFPEKQPAEILALARENILRIGENYACAIKTAGMNDAEILRVLTARDPERINTGNDSRNVVYAVGHFGNFELYARASLFFPGWQIVTTYRGLKQPAFNRLLIELRRHSGALYFDRRHGGSKLKEAMRGEHLMVGLLADQHAGDGGERLPFLGRECSTTTAPVIFALRYNCALHTAICRRVDIGRWSLDMGPEIPVRETDGGLRPVETVTAEINRAFEEAIRADPANWFWVHRRWKPASQKQLARLAERENRRHSDPPEPREQ